MKTLGCVTGVPEHIVNRCLERMAIWARLALDIVRAEWPAFELVQATTIFNITRKVKAVTNQWDCLRHLAGYTGTDATKAAQQYRALLPAAQYALNNGPAATALDA